MFNQIKNSKPVKSDLTPAKSIKSVNLIKSVLFYKFTKFMIWTNLSSNLALKYLLTNFAKLKISFKTYIG